MKPPKKVNVGAVTYKVILDSGYLNAEAVNTGAIRGFFGLTEHHGLTIHLHEDNALDRQREVLLHEVLHTITEFSGAAGTLGLKVEEDVVTRIAPVLLTVLQDNPKLVDFLLGPA